MGYPGFCELRKKQEKVGHPPFVDHPFFCASLRCALAYGVRKSFFLRFYGTAEAVP
jgi:hypothetical protein